MNRILAIIPISEEWLTAFVVAIIGAMGGVWLKAKHAGRQEGAESVTINDPVPEVPTRKVSTPPSWDAHRALMDRVTRQEQISNELRHDLSEVRQDMANQYRELLTAGHARETTITDKLDGIARGIHARIDDILKSKPTR